MTPENISVVKRGDKFVELSHGRGINNASLYGVSVFKQEGDHFEPQPESRSFVNREDAEKYRETIK